MAGAILPPVRDSKGGDKMSKLQTVVVANLRAIERLESENKKLQSAVDKLRERVTKLEKDVEQ